MNDNEETMTVPAEEAAAETEAASQRSRARPCGETQFPAERRHEPQEEKSLPLLR